MVGKIYFKQFLYGKIILKIYLQERKKEEMRFSISFSTGQESIPIDYHRMILSFFKKAFEKSDPEYFSELYKDEVNKMKSYVFSVYFYKPEIMREEIKIHDKRFKVFISTYDTRDGIKIFNAFTSMRGNEHDYKGYKIIAEHIDLLKEMVIKNDEVIFKTLSPIVIKQHEGDNKRTWYHSLENEEGRDLFVRNLKNQLEIVFGDEEKRDFEEIGFELIKNKMLKIKHYDIVVNCNHAIFKLRAKPYILDYFYKSGIGANRSRGFGFIDVMEGGV